jgi:hypothetical protein
LSGNHRVVDRAGREDRAGAGDRDAIDSGAKPGLTTDERKELVELRRRLRVLEMKNEILKRASAYFARENVLPNRVPAGLGARRGRCPRRGGLPVPKGLNVGLLGVGQPAAVSPRGRGRVADHNDPQDSCRLARDVWGAAGAGGAAARSGRARGRKRVARLMRLDGLAGVSHRRKRRG